MAPPSVSQRAAIGAGWIIAWRMTTRNIGLLSTLVLVRLLQPTDFGLVALATGFTAAVDALSAIGIQDALARAPTLDRDMYDTGFALSILRAVVTAILIAAIAWPVANFFHDQRLSIVMLALSAGTMITAFENIGIVDFRRNLGFRKEFEMQLWSRVIGAATTVGVAAIWHSYWALIAGILVYRIVRVIQSYKMSPYRPHLTLRAWRKIIGFSLWTWAQTMLYQVRDRSDAIVIGRLLGTTQVGAYSVGLEFGSLPTTELVEPLGRALFSGFASLHNASEGLMNMFLGAVGTGLLLILPASVGISMIADPMTRFALGEHWLAAIPVVQITAIGGATAIVSHACGNLLNAIGRPSTTFYVCAVSMVVKLIALRLLVPEYGLIGAAVALLIGSFSDFILLVIITLPLIRVSLTQLATCAVRPSVATAAMVILLWRLDMAWEPSKGQTVFDLGLDSAERAGIGAACYTIVLAATWVAAGRPIGAERFVLDAAGNLWQRVRHWACARQSVQRRLR